MRSGAGHISRPVNCEHLAAMPYNPTRSLEFLRLGTQNPRAAFRDDQEQSIQHVVDGRGRLLVVQKTGWGKSSVNFIATKLLREEGMGPAILVARTYPIAFPISGKTWVNNHAHVLRFANACTQKFVEIYLNSIKLNDLITRIDQPKLNKAMFDKIPIPYPEVSKQQRIATCLTSLDDLIAAQTQKHEALKTHKRGLMQQLFPSPEEVAG